MFDFTRWNWQWCQMSPPHVIGHSGRGGTITLISYGNTEYWSCFLTQIYFFATLFLSVLILPFCPLPACIGNWNKSGRGWDRIRAKRMSYFLMTCFLSSLEKHKRRREQGKTPSTNKCGFKMNFIGKQGQYYFFFFFTMWNAIHHMAIWLNQCI